METAFASRTDGLAALAGVLHANGYAFVPSGAMLEALGGQAAISDWDRFASGWHDLPLDTFMADHGRYRRRRHAAFQLPAQGPVRRLPPQPHFQALDYNPLNGGVQRWFEPVDADAARGATLQSIFAFCQSVFGRVDPAPAGWFVEIHQFRIEARPGEPGLPTPEGMHRDGVDHVLVLLVRRSNVREGTTLIGRADGTLAGSFTLAEPLDAALVEDRRMHHGVTAVEPVDPEQAAWRDVLVVTLKRA